jgi:single-strand DNA-binding protein
VASFSIATTEKMGEKEHTEWHKIVTWNKTAENCSKYLAKGKSVFVEGRIRTRSWEDKEGQRRWATEIQADRVVFLGGGKKEESDADYNQSGSGASGNSAEW